MISLKTVPKPPQIVSKSFFFALIQHIIRYKVTRGFKLDDHSQTEAKSPNLNTYPNQVTWRPYPPQVLRILQIWCSFNSKEGFGANKLSWAKKSRKKEEESFSYGRKKRKNKREKFEKRKVSYKKEMRRMIIFFYLNGNKMAE